MGNSMNLEKGFTLVELLITIAVLSILSVIAAPAMVETYTMQNLNQSTSDLVGKIQYAQSKAMLERKEVQLTVNSSTAKGDKTIVIWNPSGSSSVVSKTANIIYFGPGGYPQKSLTNDEFAGVQTIVICNQATADATYSRVVKVNRLGLVIESGIKGGCSAS